MGSYGDENILFRGALIQCSNSFPRKKLRDVSVILRETSTEPKEYKLKLEHQASVTFSAEDLYFYEKDEIEMRRGHRFWFCWRMNGTYSLKHRRYVAVTLVIKKQCTVHQFTFCGSPTDNHGSIGALWNILKETFGEIESWFVKLPEDQNRNLRLAVSKKNFCLLDSRYEIFQDFKFKTVKCDVSFNSGTDTLELKVYTDVGEEHPDFVKNHTMHLRASKTFAEPIQKLLVIRTLEFKKNDPDLPELHKWILESSHSSFGPTVSPDSALVNLASSDSVILNPESSCTPLVNPESSDTVLVNPGSSERPLLVPGSSDCPVENSECSETSLPPPSPCLESSEIFVELPPPTPHTSRLSVLKCKFHAEDFEKPPRFHSKSVLFRSESTACISESDQYKKWNHRNVFYENIFQYDDSTYTYRVYINEPSVRPYHPRMKVRIDRWNRLSDELEEVDHETVRRHGMWFDNQYRNRSTDDCYKKIYNWPLNIEPQKVYDEPRPTGRCSSTFMDDNLFHEDQSREYWNSDLCLTIQRVMEGRMPKMWDILSITHSQYMELSMKLDLRGTALRARDWTEFAEWIGIKSTNHIEIIQHFCYTRKMVIMEVVFCHWYYQSLQGRAVPKCNYDMLMCVLTNMDRYDLIHVIRRNNTHVDEGEESDEDNTHF